MFVHDKIKAMRHKNGISGGNLAKLLHSSQSSISKIENGVLPISPEMLESLKEITGYAGVPVTEDEINNFRKDLYDFYDTIKNAHLVEAREESNRLQSIIEKCFEEEFKILYCLFDSYLLLRERQHHNAKNKLEYLTDKLYTLTDEQQYFYYYFYAGSIYKDYAKSIQYFLKAEKIAEKRGRPETSLYYSLSNMYSRIDYSFKSIMYGEMALKMAQNSSDKAYLLNIEATLAFEYARVGCYQLALNGLYGCLTREKALGDTWRLEITHHNLACVYLYMKDYTNTMKHLNKALGYCNVGDRAYLNNKLHIAYVLIDQNENKKALSLIEEFLPNAQDIPDMLLLLESAKHSLNLNNAYSLAYIEDTSIPQLLKMGEHEEAIRYMHILSNFYKKFSDSKKFIQKRSEHLELALFYTNKILKGEL